MPEYPGPSGLAFTFAFYQHGALHVRRWGHVHQLPVLGRHISQASGTPHISPVKAIWRHDGTHDASDQSMGYLSIQQANWLAKEVRPQGQHDEAPTAHRSPLDIPPQPIQKALDSTTVLSQHSPSNWPAGLQASVGARALHMVHHGREANCVGAIVEGSCRQGVAILTGSEDGDARYLVYNTGVSMPVRPDESSSDAEGTCCLKLEIELRMSLCYGPTAWGFL